MRVTIHYKNNIKREVGDVISISWDRDKLWLTTPTYPEHCRGDMPTKLIVEPDDEEIAVGAADSGTSAKSKSG